MSALFGGAKTPAPTAPPPPPTADNSASVLAEEARNARIARGTSGRASTQLTGGSGVEEDTATAKKKLLGS